MSVNKDRPHVLVLPEDDANRQLAIGFHLEVEWARRRQMQVLSVAGGWTRVLEVFQSDHVVDMQKYPQRFMILLIDFDEQAGRLTEAKAAIPEHLTARVFVLGAWSHPEVLKRAGLGSYENVGLNLAEDCRKDTHTTWDHELLRHNASELDRLRRSVRPILFPPT